MKPPRELQDSFLVVSVVVVVEVFAQDSRLKWLKPKEQSKVRLFFAEQRENVNTAQLLIILPPLLPRGQVRKASVLSCHPGPDNS